MRALVAVAVLALSGGCVGESEGAPPTTPAPPSSTESTATAEVTLDTDPYDTVRNVYRGVAAKAPDEVCARFTPEAAAQFAGAFEGESCDTVVVLLHHGLVADPEAYANTTFGYFTADDGEVRVEIDSCEFEVRGGSRLGVFVVDRGATGTWRITAHRMAPCDR